VKFLDTNGNVGIGTTSPGAKLQMNDATFYAAAYPTRAYGALKVISTYAGTGSVIASFTNANAAGGSQLNFYTEANYASALQAIDNPVAGSVRSLLLNPEGGNVGIGTTAPGAKLDVSGNVRISGSTPTYLYLFPEDGFGYIVGGSGANAGPSIHFSNYSRTGFIGGHLSLAAGYDAANTTTSQFINFYTNNGLERMRITRDGNVGIGTTAPGQKLTVNGNMSIAAGNGLYLDGGGNTYIYEAIADRMDLVAGGTSQVQITNTGVNVVGALTKGSGTFKIDHPLQPDDKFLYHSFIEGPRVDLIYRGTAKLVDGKAVVDLNKDSTVHPMMDGTFEALTQNAVVTSLQNQDSFDRVKPSEINGALFEITSENPDSTDEVAWVVMAERVDPFIKTVDINDDNGRLIPEHDKGKNGNSR